jgi:hypothetical protein
MQIFKIKKKPSTSAEEDATREKDPRFQEDAVAFIAQLWFVIFTNKKHSYFYTLFTLHQ